MQSFIEASKKSAGAPLFVLAILAMMIVPLPAMALDVLFTFNIAFSLIILLVVIYVLRPLEFGVFPTILLVATLLRLALNIASTRVVLLNGHTGPGAAGKVIESFGNFVIGGNYAVGLVVFTILVIINFVVVTKGAGRISEVTARFTLDALPGKQMSIDADLNAGLIDQEEAKKRRYEVTAESEFYGAMDGASKFVRGDAIAGIIILFINIVGGLFIGMLQFNLDFSTALENYVLLTIGDGLVAQIPSLMLSVAAAVIITRVSSSEDMGSQVTRQLFDDPKPLAVTAGIIGVMGLIPGMPNAPFLFFALLCGGGAWWIAQRRQAPEPAQLVIEESLPEVSEDSPDLSWEDVRPVDAVSLEVGYGLIPLVDKDKGAELMGRIKGVRKKLSQEIGFLIPPVHIHDNLNLSANTYCLRILGVEAGGSEVEPHQDMAINPGVVYGQLQGKAGRDPAFDLEAVWIDRGQREHAQTLGYTVVDTSTVVATHLSQVLKKNAHRLLGHDEAQRLLDNLARTAPKLVENLVPDSLSLGVVVKVLQGLLEEEIPIRDMRTIAETLADCAQRTKDPVLLLSEVRAALGRLIVQQITGSKGELPTITLDASLEQLLLQSASGEGQSGTSLEPGLADRLMTSLQGIAQQQEVTGETAVLLVPAVIRQSLARWLKHAVPNIKVLAYTEVPDDWQIKIVSTVGA